jgi:arsenite oxidase small subunit
MTVVSRRKFLKMGGGGIAVGAAALGSAGALAKSEGEPVGRTTLPYPEQPIGMAAKMPVNQAVNFTYPDETSPCVALKIGSPVPGGVGPDGDIVAFSTLCTHMGCVVNYDAGTRNFKCPCHFSIYDGEKKGQMVIGQSTTDIPSIILDYNAEDDSVTAIGVDGLIFGRQSNVL